MTHEPCRCPAYGRKCARCGHSNHSKRVYRNLCIPAPKEKSRDWCREVSKMCQDNDDPEVSASKGNVVKSEVFNYHCLVSHITKIALNLY